MKKILTTLATLTVLATTLSADFIRVEAGAGMWNQKSVGFFNYEDGSVSARDESQEVESPTGYAWVYIKHFLPIIPNLRLEYSKIESEGRLTSTGKILGLNAEVKNLPTTLDMTQFEVIPYYNLLDNTFWITVDAGLAIKIINYHATGTGEAEVGVNGLPLTTTTNIDAYDETGTLPVPLLYARARVQVPMTGLGIEATGKYLSDGGDNTFSDFNLKVDYTLDITPIIQPGFEIGYRVITMNADIDDGSTKTLIDYSFSGLYAGLMVRF